MVRVLTSKEGQPYLQHRLAQENHLFPCFFDDKVLDLEPLLAVTTTSTGTEMNLPSGIFLVTRGACNGFVRNVRDQIINDWLAGGWRIKIYGSVIVSAENAH